MNNLRGFSLIELLTALAIITILLGIAFPNFLKYRRKAKLTSYALPVARGCAMDILAYCIENPNGNLTSEIQAGKLPNCGNSTSSTFNSAVGSGKLNVLATECKNDGTPQTGPDNLLINATLDNISDYVVKCYYINDSLKCIIEEI